MIVEPTIRTPELQAQMEMRGVLHALALVTEVWAMPTNKMQWLAISNALWQANRVSEELRLYESAETLADMAGLDQIRAEMEAV